MREIIDSTFEPALWFAADWSLRWAVLLAVVFMLLWIVRPRRAAIRQLFLWVALIAGLLVPFAPRWGSGWERHQLPEPEPSPSPSPSFPRSAWERTPGRSASRPTPRPDATQSVATVRSHAERGNEEPPPLATSEPLGLRRLIVLSLISCWSVAVACQLIRHLCGWIFLRRLRRESVEATGAMADLFAACRMELGVRGAVRLATHPSVRSPVLFGWRRPWVVVPPDYPRRTIESQRAGLLHELAHVRRRDHLLAPLLEIVRIAFFFHPLVRWLLARLEYERELLCDEMVVRLGIDRRDYARLLVEFARSSGRLAWSAVALPMSRRRTVKGRVYHLLEEDMERWIRPLPARWAIVLGSGLLALSLGLTSYRVWAEDKTKPEASAEKPEQQPPAEKPAASQIKREDLRYGGKDFYQWRRDLLTELKGTIRVDGMKAFAAFGANGYGPEAMEAILDIMRGYNTMHDQPLDDDGAVVRSAYEAIGKIGAVAVPTLTKAVKDKNRNVRRFAVKALGSLGTDARSAMPEILQAMKGDDSQLQRVAIAAVRSIDWHAEGVVTALVETLKGKAPGNRSMAVQLLSDIGEEARPAIPALIAVLKDKDANVRRATAQALRVLGAGKEAVVPVSRLLQDEDFNVRNDAYQILDRLGADAKDAVPALIAVLKDPRDRCTGWAADILGKIGPDAKEAVPALTELLRSDDVDLRKRAIVALKKISPEDKH
ncbi:MAG TPA: M56 family metallopeptidase [Gemmataceae bacterium]|nr:M56 family metallopeptidase [Gemmataceae bacterium]